MPDITYSTGPIEQESGVDQLRLKALNNSSSGADVAVALYDLNGTKQIFYTNNFFLEPGSSDFFEVDIPNLFEFEVEFFVTNPEVYVAVFAINTSTGLFSAANSVRHAEMINTSAGQ